MSQHALLALTTDAVEQYLQELSLRYGVSIENAPEVRAYLQAHPALKSALETLLYTAQQQIPEARLTIGIYHDPEEDDTHLIVYARCADYSESFLDRLQRVRGSLNDQLGRLLQENEGWIFLTTDFRPAG